MTREETQKILAIVGATYPNFQPDDKTSTVDAWHFMTAEYDYNSIAIALKAYVTTSNSAFAPTVSQLISMVHKPQEFNQISEVEAWDKVNRAIRNSSYHAQEEFDKLDPISQRCVGSPSQLRSWALGSEDALDTVIASHFMRSYRALTEKQAEYEKLPMEAKTMIGATNDRYRLE